MNLFARLGNIWKLSEYVPGRPEEEYKTPGTVVANIIKKPQPARFIAFVKEDPITKLVNETPE